MSHPRARSCRLDSSFDASLRAQRGKSNKFWEIEVDGKSFTVRYGRIGTAGKTLTKSAASTTAAKAEAEKLVGEKLGKGYAEVGGETAAPMSEEVFWRIIALFNWKKTGDDDAVLLPAVTALARMSVEDIFAFDEVLAE